MYQLLGAGTVFLVIAIVLGLFGFGVFADDAAPGGGVLRPVSGPGDGDVLVGLDEPNPVRARNVSRQRTDRRSLRCGLTPAMQSPGPPTRKELV